MRYIMVLSLMCIFASPSFGEDCDTDCGDQCRVVVDPPEVCSPWGGGCISIGGGAEFIDPACNAKCETVKAAACMIHRPLPNVPVTIKEQIEGASRSLCGIGFYAFTTTIDVQCSQWDGRLENQDQIAAARDLLIQRGYFTSADFNGVQVRWCPLDGHTAGIAPSRGKVYLNTNYRNIPTKTLAPLLAHEMIHQKQYRSAGDDQFRCDYSRHMIECGMCQTTRHPMENEAYSFENRVRADLGSGRDLPSVGIVADRADRIELSAPSRVFVEGFNGPTYVRGVFEKQGRTTWIETNDQSPTVFKFAADSEAFDKVALSDDSRNMVLEIDLNSKKVKWKLRNGNVWTSMYDITAIDTAPRRIFFRGTNAGALVNGELKKASDGTWTETNSQSDKVITSKVVLEKPEGLVLQDPSRNMLLEVNLRNRKMRWRLDSESKWHPLYDIVGVN